MENSVLFAVVERASGHYKIKTWPTYLKVFESWPNFIPSIMKISPNQIIGTTIFGYFWIPPCR